MASTYADVAPAQPCSFSPARPGVCADQHEGAVMRRHLVDEALDLALRWIERRLLARSGKGHCARGIDLNALVSNRSSRALPQSENSLAGSSCGQPRVQES